MALIDTDWSTLDIDVGDDELRERVRNATHTERQLRRQRPSRRARPQLA